jgi:hypothetical protein
VERRSLGFITFIIEVPDDNVHIVHTQNRENSEGNFGISHDLSPSYRYTRIDMVELICKAEYLYDFSRLPDPTVLFCVKICFSFLNNVNIKIKLFTACFLFLKLTLKKGSYQSFRIRHQNSDNFFL